jgi:hypothetical protein
VRLRHQPVHQDGGAERRAALPSSGRIAASAFGALRESAPRSGAA